MAEYDEESQFASRWYWLDSYGDPVRHKSMDEYFSYLKSGKTCLHHIGYTDVCGYGFGSIVLIAPVIVSTVFLRLDHGFSVKARPVLFESMIFGGPLNDEQVRYCTIEEAQDGHQLLIKRARLARWAGRQLTEWWVPET